MKEAHYGSQRLLILISQRVQVFFVFFLEGGFVLFCGRWRRWGLCYMPELLCGEATGVRINLLLNNIWPLGETHAEARPGGGGGGGGLFFTSDCTTLEGRTLKRTEKGPD